MRLVSAIPTLLSVSAVRGEVEGGLGGCQLSNMNGAQCDFRQSLGPRSQKTAFNASPTRSYLSNPSFFTGASVSYDFKSHYQVAKKSIDGFFYLLNKNPQTSFSTPMFGRPLMSADGEPQFFLGKSAQVSLSALSSEMDQVPEKVPQETPRIPRVGNEQPKNPHKMRVPAPGGQVFENLQETLRDLNIATVCQEAQCPNIGECWSGGTGTIMLLGDTCTRGCKFCAVNTAAQPAAPDVFEPLKVAGQVGEWAKQGLQYVVLTSVDRDDLPDGGAEHFAQTVESIHEVNKAMVVECLVGDFSGDETAVKRLANSGLRVYAHNLETVRRLQPYVRDRRANYEQSLRALACAKEVGPEGLYTKTSLMLGLGETESEVIETMQDLRSNDVDVLTLGQYLRPTDHHLAVVEFLSPEKFFQYEKVAMELGFKHVVSGANIRSSYMAGKHFEQFNREI